MQIAKTLAEKAREAGAVRDAAEFFAVTEKQTVELASGDTTTVDVPNGPHKVKIISEKLGKGQSFNGKDQDELQLVITDNGKQKLWNMPVKNEDGTLYYLIEDLESIEIGEEFMVEAVKMKNGKYAKRISKVGHQREEIPTIQLNEPASEEVVPDLSVGDDISPEDIPF
jgi:hypothetical protein